MKLVLIEAPAKKESIEKYLGKDYKVVASFGHVRDLPEKKLGVDIANNFAPDYTIMPDKQKLVDKLKSDAKKADEILFATDPDREGEAIAWHLASILKVDPASNCRVVYNEISKKVVQEAVTKPRPIDKNLFDAQQARRVLDRLVGYKLSPLICKKIRSKLSAGRVQSVTLKLVVERDREIESFVPVEFWTLFANLSKKGAKEKFKAVLDLPKSKKIGKKDEMDKILKDIDGKPFVVENVKKFLSKSHAPAPFTTMSMQQDAASKLGMSLKATSATAQSLYEGVDIEGEGKTALVTYIRTDSVRVAPTAQAEALEFVRKKFGDKFVPEKPNFFASKKGAQDAHEAIRPISIERTPESLKGKIQNNQYRLYKLIYERFLASQMAEAEYDSMTVDILCNAHKFKVAGKSLKFAGFTAVYGANVSENSEDDENENSEKDVKLPALEKGDVLENEKLVPEQKFTKPPARFNESTLVKAMEEKGIGRPSTTSQTVTTILSRMYVEKQGKNLVSTELGRAVVDLLNKFFVEVMDVKFTAEMENKLDEIEDGGKNWQKIVEEFYKGFEKELKAASSDTTTSKLPDVVSDVVCEKCGAKMVIKEGRFGKFLACPNFPKCRNTKQLVEPVGKCPKCGADIVKKRTKTGKFFFGCSKYPECDFSTWDSPTKKVCSKCGYNLFLKNFKGKKSYVCPKCEHTEPFEKPEEKEVSDS